MAFHFRGFVAGAVASAAVVASASPVWAQDVLNEWNDAWLDTIRAVGGPAVLVADGHAAEGKGIWVIRNGEFEIEGFDFVGARVPSRNGAGIRFERGKLTVRDSRFIDNQMGLLTGNDAASELTVERCEFSGPTDGDHWYHNLYAGTIARLTLIGSWSHKARRGHLVKSRARENHILYNRLTDEGGNASYELEFPNGGIARAIGNVIEQSPRTDNRTLVSFGAEGYRWPVNRLAMSHNTVVNRALNGTFVRVSPGDASVKVAVQLYNNLWVGPGDAILPPGIAESGNHDNRNYEDDWGERYHGLLVKQGNSDNYEAEANQTLAKNLKGKLLLAHGTLDDNVPPDNTYLVVDALIKAGKDFDLLMIPNAAHGFGAASNYMMRRRWDYFVQHLMGATPPKEYQIGPK